MGKRSERRSIVSIPIVVRGKDKFGNSFVLTAKTHDVSVSGACIEGLHGVYEPGTKMELESRGRKAWFRVQWVGASGTNLAGLLGVKCLEPGNCIWDVPMEAWKPDEYERGAESEPAAEALEMTYGKDTEEKWDGRDRRVFPRRPCRIDARVALRGESIGLAATVTDISAGGCYLEMLAPLPVGSIVELTLQLAEVIMHTLGKVRASQPGLGMGVAFTEMSPEDCEILIQFATAISDQEVARSYSVSAKLPQGKPEPLPQGRPNGHKPAINMPKIRLAGSSAADQAVEAIVRILVRKGLLENTELFDELEKIKGARG
jgi:hypothetical protein